jgi:hypothetical protein
MGIPQLSCLESNIKPVIITLPRIYRQQNPT